jgi:hypothetical protein
LDVAFFSLDLHNVLGILFGIKSALKLTSLNAIEAGDGGVGAFFGDSESESALDFDKIEGDILFGVGGECEVDDLVAFVEGVLLTEALGEIDGGDLCGVLVGSVLTSSVLISGVLSRSVGVGVIGISGTISSVAISSVIGINSLNHNTEGDIGCVICIDSDKELCIKFSFFEGKRVEQGQVNIILGNGITELHVLPLFIGRAHNCRIPTDHCHKKHHFFHLTDLVRQLKLVVVVRVSVEEVLEGVGLLESAFLPVLKHHH